MREVSRGSKHKIFYYQARKIQLNVPTEVRINNVGMIRFRYHIQVHPFRGVIASHSSSAHKLPAESDFKPNLNPLGLTIPEIPVVSSMDNLVIEI